MAMLIIPVIVTKVTMKKMTLKQSASVRVKVRLASRSMGSTFGFVRSNNFSGGFEYFP